MTAASTITGRCHCGSVSFALEWSTAAGTLVARACQCSFCQMHGARWTSSADARVSLSLPAEDTLIRYRFGHQTADFIVCATCGILTVALDQRADPFCCVVNVNTFESHDPDEFETVSTDFDGEDDARRTARRRHNWSPVTITTI